MLVLVVPARAAFGQPAYEWTPSLNIVESYDSNLFFASTNPQSDYITRMTPGIESSYRSPLVTLTGSYALDFERFVDHPALTAVDGQHASAAFHYMPTRLFEVGADGTFTRTQTPAALGAESGLVLTRGPANHFFIRPSVVRHLDAVTDASAEWSLTRDHLSGGARLRVQTGAVRLERHVSARQTVTVGYAVQRFDFEPAALSATLTPGSTSHQVIVDWTGELSRETSLNVHGGPRVTDGHLAPEIAASIRTARSATEFSIGYAQTKTTLIGVAGIVATRSITGSAAWTRWRRLQLRTAPGLYEFASGGLQVRAYRIGFEASRPITKTYSIVGAYDATLQHGNFYSAVDARYAGLSRHTMSVGVTRTAAGIPR
jgi:hypothetical protein